MNLARLAPNRPTGLDEFYAMIEPGRDYAVLTADRLATQWVGALMLDAVPHITVHWGAAWIWFGDLSPAPGARVLLQVIDHEARLQTLRGLRLHGALLVHGAHDRRMPDELQYLLPLTAADASFAVKEVQW